MKVLVVCCLHGHETFGLRVNDYLIRRPIKGVSVLIGNPRAINKGLRFIDSDLNRSFGGGGSGYEKSRAKEILKEVAGYDYLIDVHTTTTKLNIVPIITSLKPKTKKLINLIDAPRVALVRSPLAQNSLVGQFGEGAVSLEVGLQYSRKAQALEKIIDTIEQLVNGLGNSPKSREVYYLSDTVPLSFKPKAYISNFAYIEELKGFGFLIGEKSYDDFRGFVATKMKKTGSLVMNMSKEVILTGIRSNDEPTLGNYLGAFLPMVELQKKHAGSYQLNMFVPDLHSFTTPIDHGNLYENSIKNLKYFMAAGLNIDDPDTFIYRQSYIPAHSEMTWILNCFSYFGELSRMTEFKEKAGDQANVSVGLFNYPVLMAADILLYGAKYVPVGDDQRQHVEFTRTLATRMNNKFGDLFVVPEDNAKQAEFAGRSEPVRIRSLRNPEKKMSKSVEDPAGTILLSDSPDDAAQKVLGATTDSLGAIKYDWDKQPGVSNLLQILNLLSNRPKVEVVAEWEGKSSYGELKTAVAEAVKEFLSGFQSKLAAIDEGQMLQKLKADESAMTLVANETLQKVQKAVGLRPKN